MSWKSIAGNQTVSRENLQNAVDTGVFVQKAPIPSGYATKQITKAETDSYIATWELYPPYRNKTPNQLPVKSDLAVQSNQIFANTTGLSLGNNNRSWVIPLLSVGGDEFGSVASATDNRCILAGKRYDPGSGGGGAWVSSNYGETFRRLDEVMTTNDAALGAAMNSYGDYMIITRQVGSFDGDRAKIYWSYNSGVDWAVGYQDGVRYNFNGAAMSGIGVYATVLGSDGSNYYVFRSTSFGSSFTKVYLCRGSKVNRGGCVGMSKSGQYQLLTPPQSSSPDIGYFYVSNDWGESWTTINVTPIPLAPNDQFYGCSVSAGGDYMTVVAYSVSLGVYRTYISNDWGVTWNVVSEGAVGQAVDSSGQFQYQSGRASVDYGNTWGGGPSYGNAISVNPTTFTAPYLYGIPYSVSYVWQSTNQGASFNSLTNSPSGTITYIVKSGGSYDGKYVGAIRNNYDGTYTLFTSSDYGANWVTHFGTSGEELRVCAVSDDGQYWLAVGYNPSNYSLYIYRSTDGGVTWSYTYNTYIGTPVDCAISNDGKYMTIIYQGNGAGYADNVINSFNYGQSWTFASAPPNPIGRIYNSIAMSGYGRFRAMLVSDSGLDGCRIFYSSDYGFNWDEKEYIDNFYGTCISMDDTGRVGMAGVAKVDNSESRIYYSIASWDHISVRYYDPFQIPMAYSPIITGVNVSSDGTYWSAVSYNLPYSFTSVNIGYDWTRNNLSYAINKLTK